MAHLEYFENSKNSILCEPSQKIEFPLSEDQKQCIKHLIKFHDALGGVGLAAPQIGYSWSIMIVEISKDAASIRDHATPFEKTVFINPSYTPQKNAKIVEDFEGCFSLKDTCGWVPRYNKIHFQAFDEKGIFFEWDAEGFLARVLQHETDHLDGILIKDRMNEDSVQGSLHEMIEKRRNSLPLDKRAIFDKIRKKQTEN